MAFSLIGAPATGLLRRGGGNSHLARDLQGHVKMKPTSQKYSHFRSRVRDFALYILISLACVITPIVLMQSGVNAKATNQWFTIIFFTSILYGAFIAANRSLFRMRSFWILTVVLLSLHLVFFITMVTQIDQWRPIWSAIMFFEAPILDTLKSRFISRRHKNGGGK